MRFLITIPLGKPRPFCVNNLTIISFSLRLSIIHILTALFSNGGQSPFRLRLQWTFKVCWLVEGFVAFDKLGKRLLMLRSSLMEGMHLLLYRSLNVILKFDVPILSKVFELLPRVKD